MGSTFQHTAEEAVSYFRQCVERCTTTVPIRKQVSTVPNIAEVARAIKQLSSGKAQGSDGIPPEIYKCGGTHMNVELTKLFTAVWRKSQVPKYT